MPADPVNNSIEATSTEARNNKSYGYAYYKYSAGSNGCDIARGDFYVLGAITMATTGIAKHPSSPGFQCSERDWQTGFAWVAGGYEN